MNRSKIKTFVKEHGVKIIAGISVVAVGAVVYKVMGENPNLSESMQSKIRNIDVPESFAVGSIKELFEDGEEVVTIAEKLTVNDLGKFGKELIRHGLVKDGAEAAVMAEFLKEV